MRLVIRAVVALAMLMACAAVGRAEAGKFGDLSVDDVAKKTGDKKVYIFDCNPREEWAEGHVPGAKWIDFSQVKPGDLPSDKKAMLVFYCENEH